MEQILNEFIDLSIKTTNSETAKSGYIAEDIFRNNVTIKINL